jgi:hypothetical protein
MASLGGFLGDWVFGSSATGVLELWKRSVGGVGGSGAWFREVFCNVMGMGISMGYDTLG